MAEAILDYAGQANVDQVVVATHGYGRIKRSTHGSVAERVLQTTRVPLLLVHADEREVAALGNSRRGATECWCH